MITTWLDDDYVSAHYSSVKDKDVNDLFQEVRSIDDRIFLDEKTYRKKRLIGKNIETTAYTMYSKLGKVVEYQIFNFPSFGESSICLGASKETIITYFLGFLNGHNYLLNFINGRDNNNEEEK